MARLTTDQRNALPGTSFAFSALRKEPLENASHVRNALARFRQVTDVTDGERDAAWKQILKAGKRHHVAITETDWRELKP